MKLDLKTATLRIALLGMLGVCAVGCANSKPRGGGGEAALGGSLSNQTAFDENAGGQRDYRQVLADPGWF